MATVEIVSYGTRVSAEGNRLKIERPDVEPVFAVIEDLDLVVIELPAVDVTGKALVNLASAGVPVMLCDAMHKPAAWVQPLGIQSIFTPERARRQARMPERTRARIWRALVRGKIYAQACALARIGETATATRLHNLAREVGEGDPANVEATAARLYWPALFGAGFLRRSGDARSNALDFGYSVLRSMVCRAIVASGLHPDLGVFHRSTSNGFNLADDLIEPYRPVVDLLVRKLIQQKPDTDLRKMKPHLSCVGEAPVQMGLARMRCRSAISATASSFVRMVDGNGGALDLPEDFPMDEDDA